MLDWHDGQGNIRELQLAVLILRPQNKRKRRPNLPQKRLGLGVWSCS